MKIHVYPLTPDTCDEAVAMEQSTALLTQTLFPIQLHWGYLLNNALHTFSCTCSFSQAWLKIQVSTYGQIQHFPYWILGSCVFMSLCLAVAVN